MREVGYREMLSVEVGTVVESDTGSRVGSVSSVKPRIKIGFKVIFRIVI